MPAEHPSLRPADPVTCDDLAGLLPALVDDPSQAGVDAAGHVAVCLRCQADLARYRRLRRDLRKLQVQYIPPAPGYVRATVGAVEAEMTRRAHVALAAYVGGAVVATAASAAGMLVWATRRRVALAS